MNNGVEYNDSILTSTSPKYSPSKCAPTVTNLTSKNTDPGGSIAANTFDSEEPRSSPVISTENDSSQSSIDSSKVDKHNEDESPSPAGLAHISSHPPVTSTSTQAEEETQPGAPDVLATAGSATATDPFAPAPPNASVDGRLPGLSGPNQGEYYVMVHVDAGETFSVRVGDQIQHIPGPATVRMVSNSGPPLPMPMRVPPGHLVQQIVDEEGILTHVILSLYPGPGHPPPVPPGVSQANSAGGAPLNSATQTNGLITAGSGLVLDPTPHLHHHPAPHPHQHHPSASSPVSTVGSGTHLGIGVPAMTPFNPHQPLPTHPPGAPPLGVPPSGAHFTTPFLPPHPPIGPQPHFHAPYPFHHPHHHPSMCSPGVKPHPQQTPPSVPTMAGPHFPVPPPVTTDWAVNGVTETEAATMMMPGPAHVGAMVEGDYQHEDEENEEEANGVGHSAVPEVYTTPGLTNGDRKQISPLNKSTESAAVIGPAGDEIVKGSDLQSAVTNDLASPTHTSATRMTKRPPRLQQQQSATPHWSNSSKSGKEPRSSTNLDRSIEESHNSNPEAMFDYTRTPISSEVGEKNGITITSTTGAGTIQQNSPTKSNFNGKAQPPTKLRTNDTVCAPLCEVPFDGTTSEPSQFGSFTVIDNSWGPQSASHRRRRTGAAKSNPAIRTPSRAGCVSGARSCNSVTSADLSMNTNNSSGLLVTKKPSSTVNRAPSSATPAVPISTPSATATTCPATATTLTHSEACGISTSSHPKSMHLNTSPTYSHSRGRGRTQQPYLLSTPTSHVPSSLGVDYANSPTGISYGSQPQAASAAMMPLDHSKGITGIMSGSIPRDKPQLMWESELERESIQSVLSAIPPPQVSDVEAHSALIHLSLPTDLTVPLLYNSNSIDGTETPTVLPLRPSNRSTADVGNKGTKPKPDGQPVTDLSPNIDTPWTLDEAEVQFELHLAERDIDSRFNCVFIGEATYISLQDLRPGSDYYVKACCIYSDIRGQFSTIVRFTTEPAEPSAPRNLTVIGHTRTSLHVKWSAAADNGSRITAYRLEYARAAVPISWSPLPRDGLINEGAVIPHFVEGYHGLSKTCKLTQLAPSTDYLLRVMAENSFGAGPWSAIVSASTSGSPPSTPQTPHLVNSGVHSLTLAWSNANANQHQSHLQNGPLTASGSGPTVSYTLEMEDEVMGHGFVTVFDGTGTEHCVGNLRRNTRYRFRLAAANADGRSRWSEVITLSTLPDRPTIPRTLQLSGQPHPNRLCLVWDAPEDDGGLSIQAYRLEVRLPFVPSAEVTTTFSPTTTYMPPDLEKHSTIGVEKLLCWPRATGVAGRTTFRSLPPTALSVMDGKTHPVMPRLVQPESPRFNTTSNSRTDAVTTEHEISDQETDTLNLSTLLSADDLAESGYFTDCETNYLMGWFVVYEGLGQEVVLDHLLPGSHVSFRVRACSASDSQAQPVLVGPASTPLPVVLPAIAPDAPADSPHVIGRPRPHSVCLAWPPPKSSGGAPILAYELWQLDSPQVDFQSGDSEDALDDEFQSSNFPRIFISDCAHSRSSSGCSAHAEDSSPIPPLPAASSDNLGAIGRLVCCVPSPECRVAGLRPGYTYAFRVRACNRIGRGPWSSWTRVTTVPSPPAAPRCAPRVYPLPDTDRIRISWDPVQQGNGANVSGYLLEWQPISGNSSTTTNTTTSGNVCDFQLLYSGSALSYEFDGAQPATRFAFRFCAVNSAGLGPWSPVATCLTPPACPGQPCGLRAIRVETNTIQLRWFRPQPNGSPITSFTIELTRLTKDPSTSSAALQLFDVPSPLHPFSFAPVPGSNNSEQDGEQILEQQSIDYALTDLSPNCSYRIRIRALNSLGHGAFSSPLNVVTLPPCPNAPEFTGLTHLTATSVRLQWVQPELYQLPPHSSIIPFNEDEVALATTMALSTSTAGRSKPLLYTLQISQDSDPEWIVLYEGTETSYKATRLQENSSYSFRVCASNISGPGAYSAVRTITTPRLPPPAVRGLKVTEVNVDTCQLEWTPVTLNGSLDPVVYVLHLMPVQQIHASACPIPSQIYRGCQTSCRVTDLLPNTEYVCRVGAIRLCQQKPCAATPTSASLNQQTDESQPTDQWKRELISAPEFQIAELPGPFSHRLVFTTRNQKESKSYHAVGGVSASHLHNNSLNKPVVSSTSSRWWILWSKSFLRFLGTRSQDSGAHSGSNDVSGSSSVGRSPFGGGGGGGGGGVSFVQLTSTSVSSSPWRRRIGPVSSATNLQHSPKSPGQTTGSTAQPIPLQQHQQPPHQHHHHSSTRRGHSWFRLSERKWACLLLFLFAIGTLLVAFSLQHILTVQPNSTTVTVEEVRSYPDRWRSAHHN